jgi:hypothetical protein
MALQLPCVSSLSPKMRCGSKKLADLNYVHCLRGSRTVDTEMNLASEEEVSICRPWTGWAGPSNLGTP